MMRHLLTLAFLLTAATAFATEPAGDIFAANKRLGRGINFGNALEAPREGAWGVTLKPEYFKTIKDAGFATVRVPIKWSARAKTTAPYTIDPAFFRRVDWAVEQALANRLNIILDFHHYDEMDARPDEQLPRFVALWEQIAEHYKDSPAAVYFELDNEPHGKLDEAKWNEVLPKLLAAVRKSNPTRPVIVGPAQWNGIRALGKLELPKDDRHLIVTVHCYDPFEFTHQGASWAKGSEKWRGRKWTGSDAEKAALRKTSPRTGARSTTGRSSWASSGPTRWPTWSHGRAGRASWPARPRRAASAGPTGSSAPASAPTTPAPTGGASRSRPRWSGEPRRPD